MAEIAPGLVLLALAGTARTWFLAWRASRGTALRGALAWLGLALMLATLAECVGWFEPWRQGRPVSTQIAYLASLFGLAAQVSVLNARRPGGGAWAILMGLLVLVLVLPWVEGTGLAGGVGAWRRLRLEAPWSWFFVLIALTTLTNHLPTRYGGPAIGVLISHVLIFLCVTRTDWSSATRGLLATSSPLPLAASVIWAGSLGPRGTKVRSRIERHWLWFRDHWGVVWALRTLERFNRAAESADWPIRLAWDGLVPAPGQVGLPPGFDLTPAESTLKGLLRRFVDSERLENV